MPIHLRRELVDHLIKQHFENVDGLVDEWERRAKAESNYPEPRNRTTLYKWLKDGIPAPRGESRHLVFALSGLLDTDPLAVLDYDKNGFFSNFTQLRMLLYTLVDRAIGRGVTNFAPLLDMFKPGPSWPDDAIAQRFFGRLWFWHEFDNAGHEKSADYGLIKVRFTKPQDYPIRTALIAYRRRESNDKMWRFYGIVNLIGNRLELYNEGGVHWPMDCRETGEIWFRTSFGHRPVEFRLVSLHEFAYEAAITDDMSIIGFDW
jgi:hypothetical protein